MGAYSDSIRLYSPIVENQMDKKMEYDLETGNA